MENIVPKLQATGIDRNALIIGNFNSYLLTTDNKIEKTSKDMDCLNDNHYDSS